MQIGPSSPDGIHAQVIEVLKTVYDPEIPVNIYDLGLIYDITVNPELVVDIQMTLTSPSCPVAETLPPEVKERIEGISGVTTVTVHVVWEPVWSTDRMSEAAKLQLNML